MVVLRLHATHSAYAELLCDGWFFRTLGYMQLWISQTVTSRCLVRDVHRITQLSQQWQGAIFVVDVNHVHHGKTPTPKVWFGPTQPGYLNDVGVFIWGCGSETIIYGFASTAPARESVCCRYIWLCFEIREKRSHSWPSTQPQWEKFFWIIDLPMYIREANALRPWWHFLKQPLMGDCKGS